MHTLSREGVEIGGKRRHQRFSFACFHFGDAPLMQNDAADELYPEGTFPEDPVVRFPHEGERLGQNIVEGLPLFQPFLQDGRLGFQLLFGHFFIGFSEGFDLVNGRCELFDLPFAVGSDDFIKYSHRGRILSSHVDILYFLLLYTLFSRIAIPICKFL